jgi:hypothetical protein
VGDIVPYKEAKRITHGFNHQIEGHHILEQRFLKAWGKDVDSAPAVILEGPRHTDVTQALRRAIPWGTDPKNRQFIWQKYQEVYRELGVPEWLEHIAHYFQ